MNKSLSNAYWRLVCIWYMLGAALNVAVVMYVIRRGEPAVLLLAGLWWAITLIGRKVRRCIEQKQDAKEQEERRIYRDTYIREIPAEDDSFGRIVFEHDSNLNTIGTDEYPLEKPLGRHELVLYSELEGDDPAPIAAALRFVYDNSEKILQEMYNYTLECCELYDECDKDGQPYGMEYVRENMNVYSIRILGSEKEDSVYVCLCGDIYGDDGNDLLGCHAVTADFILNTSADLLVLPEISCGLEG